MVASVFARDLFAGRVALITGGGTGIGLRTAKEFLQLGGSCIIASRKAEVIQQACEQLNQLYPRDAAAAASSSGASTGPRCIGHPVDIRKPESIAALMAWIKTQQLEGGRIDCLLNNGGGQFPSPASDISPKGWHAVIETNLTGTFMMSQAVLNNFFKNQPSGGSIVNVVVNSRNGFPNMSHTGAARAGVDNITKSLAVEWASLGVRVNAVAPGVIASSGLTRYGPAMEPMLKQAINNNYTHRLGTEAECSAAIIFLLSPASAFTTGIIMYLDGAESLYAPNHRPAKHSRNQPWDDPIGERAPLPAFLQSKL